MSNSEESFPDHSLTIIMGVPLPASVDDAKITQAVGDYYEVQMEGHAPDVEEAFGQQDIDVRGHGKVAYIISPGFTQEKALENCILSMKAAVRVLRLGGLGVKCESSEAAHSPDAFMNLANMIVEPKSNEEFIYSLLFMYVATVIADDKDYFSAGMHLLGYPDAIMDRRAADQRFEGYREMTDIFRTFQAYLVLGEDPQRFASGSSFIVSDDSPPFVQSWEPCHNYRPDGIIYNPFGRYRIESHVISEARS